MTVSARNWVWSLGATTPDGRPTVFREKFTLLAIAEMENAERGCAWPSQSKIARMTGQAERTVRTHLRQLEKLGLVRVEKRRSQKGGWERSVYVLPVPESFRQTDREWMAHQNGEWSTY